MYQAVLWCRLSWALRYALSAVVPQSPEEATYEADEVLRLTGKGQVQQWWFRCASWLLHGHTLWPSIWCQRIEFRQTKSEPRRLGLSVKEKPKREAAREVLARIATCGPRTCNMPSNEWVPLPRPASANHSVTTRYLLDSLNRTSVSLPEHLRSLAYFVLRPDRVMSVLMYMRLLTRQLTVQGKSEKKSSKLQSHLLYCYYDEVWLGSNTYYI